MKSILGIFFSVLLSVMPAAGAIDFQSTTKSCGCSMDECCVQRASGNPAPVQNVPARTDQKSMAGFAVAPGRNIEVVPGPEYERECKALARFTDVFLSSVPLFERYCSLLI